MNQKHEKKWHFEPKFAENKVISPDIAAERPFCSVKYSESRWFNICIEKNIDNVENRPFLADYCPKNDNFSRLCEFWTKSFC